MISWILCRAWAVRLFITLNLERCLESAQSSVLISLSFSDVWSGQPLHPSLRSLGHAHHWPYNFFDRTPCVYVCLFLCASRIWIFWLQKKNKKFKWKQKILKFPAFSNLSFWIALISRPFLHFPKHTYHFFPQYFYLSVGKWSSLLRRWYDVAVYCGFWSHVEDPVFVD